MNDGGKIDLNSCLKPLVHLCKLQNFLPEILWKKAIKDICSGWFIPLPASKAEQDELLIPFSLSVVKHDQLLSIIKLQLFSTKIDDCKYCCSLYKISVLGISKQKASFHLWTFTFSFWRAGLLECIQMEMSHILLHLLFSESL